MFAVDLLAPVRRKFLYLAAAGGGMDPSFPSSTASVHAIALLSSETHREQHHEEQHPSREAAWSQRFSRGLLKGRASPALPQHQAPSSKHKTTFEPLTLRAVKTSSLVFSKPGSLQFPSIKLIKTSDPGAKRCQTNERSGGMQHTCY